MQNYITQTIDFPYSSVDLLEIFADQAYPFLLDSNYSNRYAYFSCDPFEVYTHKDKNHFEDLKSEFHRFTFSENASPILPGAIVGFVAYDHGLSQQQIQSSNNDEFELPDCQFGFYDCMITIDQQEQKLHISSTGYPELNTQQRLKRAQERIDYLKDRVESYKKVSAIETTSNKYSPVILESNFTPQGYMDSVNQALEYIAAGEIYQVNLSQRYTIDHHGQKINTKEIFKRLRNQSPSDFSVYYDAGHFQIISNSPERFLKLTGNQLQTQPMKGTSARGLTKEEDEYLFDSILHSKKDIAELLMITDLLRNDLGQVCKYGSVAVKDLRTITKYSTVFQATSLIQGELADKKEAFDVLHACFPGGSITGCPKIRSMQIIDELEPTRRSIYTGSFGYIGFNGMMDFNIMIRTILAHKNKFHFQVGGGIIADSTPEGEYNETLIKAKAIKECFSELLKPQSTLQNVS